MADLPPPALRLIVDREALVHNWRALDALSGAASAGAAVKADAYGLGIDNCVPALRDAGAAGFFVAHWSEVPALLPHVDPATISVLHGPMNAAEAIYARAVGVKPVINSLEQARCWNETGGGVCDLMLDSGIHRLGIAPREAADPAIAALDINIFMSHLSSADEDSPANAQQLKIYRDTVPMVRAQKYSLCNSAGIALGRDYHFDVTRPGLALYGGVPRGELAGTIRQVARVQAVLLQTKVLRAGDSAGYNAAYTAPHDHKIGIAALGYADGFLRARKNAAALKHGDNRLPVLGKISMDMTVVDLSNAPDARAGDWLEVPFDLPNAAQHSGLSQYEILTTLGLRLRQ